MVNVFAVGDMNVDLFTHVPAFTQFGTEARAERFYSTLGGNAANFAAALASLGVHTSLISCFGRGQFSQFLMSQLRQFKIHSLLHKSSALNAVSNIFVREDGERAILSEKGCLVEMDCRIVAKKLLPILRAGDMVFFGGFFHLPKMRRGFSKLLRQIKKKNAIVIFDACYDENGRWEVADFLKLVDIFMLNEIELAKITRSKNSKSGIAKLYRMGANMVVLKRGSQGADFYHPAAYTTPVRSAGLSVQAINATGAGDFFNAGFIYGLAHGFSALNCLRAGNFVASLKVASTQYCPPLLAGLRAFFAKGYVPQVLVRPNYSAMASSAAAMIEAQIKWKPDSVVSLAAGKTPAGIYSKLSAQSRSGELDFSEATFIELDEYIELEDERDSFAHFLRKSLLDKVNFKEKNIFLFNGQTKKLAAECAKFERVAKKKGIDLVLLGIGENGHIAFNEPHTKFSSATHIVKISKRILRARRKEFIGRESTHAITLGIKTILGAKRIILVASGVAKARAVANAVSGKISESVPASALRMHPNVSVILDKEAASILQGRAFWT